MSELKQIRISSLNSLIIASLPLEKRVLQSPNWHTHQVLSHSKWTENDEDRGLELARGLRVFFFKKIEANYQLSSSSVCCIATLLLMLKNISNPPVCTSTETAQLHKNCSILLMNEVNIGNCSVISTCSAMGGCTPITEEQGNKCLAKVELRGTYFRNTRLQGHHLELSSSIIIFLLFLLYLMGTA